MAFVSDGRMIVAKRGTFDFNEIAGWADAVRDGAGAGRRR
jgi:hypothetical protein